jgi:hypothetical protein
MFFHTFAETTNLISKNGMEFSRNLEGPEEGDRKK